MMRAHIRALRAEAEGLKAEGNINPAHKGLLYAMAIAKARAADALEAEDKALADKLTAG